MTIADAGEHQLYGYRGKLESWMERQVENLWHSQWIPAIQNEASPSCSHSPTKTVGFPSTPGVTASWKHLWISQQDEDILQGLRQILLS